MIFKGTGIVWDAKRKKRLCKFENGIFETEDKEKIEILKEKFEYIETIKKEEQEPLAVDVEKKRGRPKGGKK